MDTPRELMEKREQIECSWIFSLYKDPDLIPDYKNVENSVDIITEDGIFYYGLALNLYKAGYHTFDDLSICTFLEDKKALKKGFEKRGGYNTIKEITSLISSENCESYYDELCKNNMLIRLHNKGFNILDNLDKFISMTSEELYDYWDYQVSSISVDKIEKIKIEDLSEGYDDWIDRMNEATNVGFKIGSKLMDYKLAGIHTGLTLYLGGIGSGKSSSSVPLFILPAIETGHDITILCNEQSADEFRSMIIAAVLFGKIGGIKGMNRMSITLGNYDDYKKEKLKEAAEWLKRQPGKIKFVELKDYDPTSIKRIIKKQAKLGCSYFFFDVLKAVSDAEAGSWAILSDTAKMLSVLAKQENISILASAQLASDSMYRKYLDLSAIGKSRAIAECATCVIGFTSIQPADAEKIKPWQWKKNPDGSDGKVKTTYELDKDKHYICQFIMKNRWGSTQDQIIQEFDQNFLTVRDIGYYNMDYDNFKRS